MSALNKPYLIKASLLAAFALLMGLALSFFVYQSNESVKINAIDLVENRIPILSSINEVIADLSEQERIIYEFYRSQDSEKFLNSSKVIETQFFMHFSKISAQAHFTEESKKIEAGQAEIKLLFNDFNQAMNSNNIDWDKLRAILTQVTTVRLTLLPTLKSIESQTKQTVDEGHEATLQQMATSRRLVIFYGVAIVLVAGIVSWYIRRYVIAQMKNARLALYSYRNPNAILSVNNLGEVVFANPASIKLLQGAGYQTNEVDKLLPSNFLSLRQQLSENQQHSFVVEQPLKDQILQITTYWHREVDAYDIHIVDMTERKLAEEQVNHLAFYNQETTLPNQYKLNRDIDEIIQKNTSFSIGIFSIREFSEKVNTLGIEATEAIVKALAKKVSASLPPGIHFYHINDNQFALICNQNIDVTTLKNLTDSIVGVAEQSIITHCGEFFVELDFGYACYPTHADNRDNLLKNAHNALAISNEDEHSYFCLYDADFYESKLKNSELINNLRFAIERQELFLVFQPQLDIQTDLVTGIETLVRWRHEGEIVSPADFIPLAEQSGLIIPIGQWILRQAAIFTKSLTDMGYIDIVVAVNVSPRQFSHPDFCQSVQDVLDDVQLPPRNLELEITEGVFMHNEENTLSVLQELKGKGLHLSIDDFGTGYSSLSYLKRFPIDKLKVDQSFIRDCHNNDEDKAIVEMIISLGKSLNLSLIAEGVEEISHVEFLRKLGCHEIQGYWFSKPIEKNNLIAFLEEKGGDIRVDPVKAAQTSH